MLLSLLQSANGSDVVTGDVIDSQVVKDRYTRFLVGTDDTFRGKLGPQAHDVFKRRLRGPIREALAFDFSQDAGKPFMVFEEAAGYNRRTSVYSALLERYVLALAYGYCVKGIDSPHYRNPEVLRCYVQCLDYLDGRGIRVGMTFHNNQHRMNMDGAPRPLPDAGNLAEMELRMGALCQSVLLMEPHIKGTATLRNARGLVRFLVMLGKTSGHTRYYKPFVNPPAFAHRVQSDAIQNYCDTSLISALLATNPEQRVRGLRDAQRVFTDSLKVIPGWADTIKPDFVGFHHRGMYGNAYTSGFIAQAAFGVTLLQDTHYEVDSASVENLKQMILTYRLYCQKYAMPFGIRGRMPLSTAQLKTSVFSGILMFASALGLNDTDMKAVCARLWDPEHVGVDFLFSGGRGKLFRGLYALDMLHEQIDVAVAPESDPAGFWYKPYGGLAIHRRDNWMAAVKGYSQYIWDYENGTAENVYGQYLSHGMLTVFSKGNPVTALDSGYRLRQGWDWYRMPGTTAVHFPIKPQKALEQRQFGPDTFLGAVSADNQNGVFGMILNQGQFADGTPINLRAYKSVFFVDDLIVLLGSGISGGDGGHPVETTLFQSYLENPHSFEINPSTLVDPAGNGYYIAHASDLKLFKGRQKSYHENGKTPSSGNYAVAWFDHGLSPRDATYEAAVLVQGGDRLEAFQRHPGHDYQVLAQSNRLHQVYFPRQSIMGYCLFVAQDLDGRFIKRVDVPCLVMLKGSQTSLQLGVTNPDLGFMDQEVGFPNVNYKFINRGANQYLPSRPRPVILTLRGAWALARPVESIQVVSHDAQQTVLSCMCLHGMPVQAALSRMK